ncbi:MAG: NADH-quinone oxidoreductase subunit NuoE [Actinomycetia bacterium]|nr:NADH-quinone oxidoreductase subunit NuoE [Actinomycetes bacterium]
MELGQRPDEPGPPIHGLTTYPSDVTARLAADAEVIVARYPEPRSALLPLLHLVQSQDSCLTPAGIAFCAEQLDLTDAEVTAVATFYSMYRRNPTGDYLVGVCTNTLCAIMGGDAILETLQEHLGVDAGQTTEDGSITLEHVECNAACDYAPVVMVNWEFFDDQTPASARHLVDALRNGESPKPSRSSALCTFRETARTLAGLTNSDAQNDGAPPGAPTLAGLRVAQEHSMAAPPPDPRAPCSQPEADPNATDQQ